jgi:hypothetical protein
MIMARALALAACLLSAPVVRAAPVDAAPLRLVVVLVIDQFPREYLDRFRPYFGERGFRRLLESGADFTDAHYGYSITSTGPGHATILTGASPREHGLVDNSWYSRGEHRVVGCVEDARFPALGSEAATGVSPAALRSVTVGDVLRAGTGMQGKVVSVAIKDRSAVLMGGSRPNGAYWFDAEHCLFTTSRYYADKLPDWVAEFNDGEPCRDYVGKQWEKIDPALAYETFSGADDVPYEADRYGLGRTFPHPVNEGVGADRFSAVVSTPFGCDLLGRFARAALRGEELGADDVPDVLAIGFSTPDYIGHLYGPRSQEVADTVLRTDLLLAGLLEIIDFEVGSGRWALVLTSDHGIAPIPETLADMGILPRREGGYRFDVDAARRAVDSALARRFFDAENPPADFSGFFSAWQGALFPFVYVDPAAAQRLRVSLAELLEQARLATASLDGVAQVYTRSEVERLACGDDPFARAALRSWNEERGGDLLIRLAPYWIPGSAPATHGSPYEYDAHVPLVFYGEGIRPGRHQRRVSMTDLAPTLARLLGINAPPQSEGQVLSEALR